MMNQWIMDLEVGVACHQKRKKGQAKPRQRGGSPLEGEIRSKRLAGGSQTTTVIFKSSDVQDGPRDNPELKTTNDVEDMTAPPWENEGISIMTVDVNIPNGSYLCTEKAIAIHSVAGSVFEPSFDNPLVNHMLVGGFSVPDKYVELYT